MSLSPADVGYFLEVVRFGHVGRAASACGITQPAVTKALRRLEDEVGVVLFERGAHGARLTPEGQLFLDAARRFHAQHQDLVRTATELRAHEAGLLRIGITNSASDTEPVRAMSEMVRQRPGLRLKLIIGKSDALHAAVESGELDLAVVPVYPGVPLTCTQTLIREDKVYPSARLRHPLSELAAPTLQDLSQYSWVMPSRESASRIVVTRIYERAGVSLPRVALEAEYTSDAALSIVSTTDLLALVPASTLRRWARQVIALPVPALTIPRTVALITRPQATWSPLMLAFRDLLLSFASESDRHSGHA